MTTTKETTTTKIRKHQLIATLAQDYNEHFKAGHRVNAGTMYHYNGYYVCQGHGIGYVIPRDMFTKFEYTWEEVTTEIVGNTKTQKIKHCKENVTNEILKGWAAADAKKAKEEARVKIHNLKQKNVWIRKMIKAVKTGKMDKELVENLKKIEELKA